MKLKISEVNQTTGLLKSILNSQIPKWMVPGNAVYTHVPLLLTKLLTAQISRFKIDNLKPYTTRKLSLKLDTANLDAGKYRISAEINPLPYEAETEDNFAAKN